MGLLDRGFLALVGLVWASAIVATVVLWPKLGSGGRLKLVGRVATILLCQLTAIMLLAVSVNDAFDFYGSWNDLLGTSSTEALITADPNTMVPSMSASSNGGRGTVGTTPTPRTSAAPPLNVAHRYADPDSRPGSLQQIRIDGGSSGIQDQGYVYLPPQYYEAASAHTRFPVTVVLSGFPGPVSVLLNDLDTVGVMNQLVHKGTVKPMILVLLSPTVDSPRDTECADVVAGKKVESFFTHDVPSWISGHYRVAPAGAQWGVLGVSTGGFCAVKFAMRHPEIYTSAVGMSSYLHALLDSTTGQLYGGNTALRQQNDPLWRLKALPSPPIHVLLTVGTSERVVYPDVQNYLALASPPMDAASIVVPASGHNFDVWARLLPTCLQWLSTQYK